MSHPNSPSRDGHESPSNQYLPPVGVTDESLIITLDAADLPSDTYAFEIIDSADPTNPNYSTQFEFEGTGAPISASGVSSTPVSSATISSSQSSSSTASASRSSSTGSETGSTTTSSRKFFRHGLSYEMYVC